MCLCFMLSATLGFQALLAGDESIMLKSFVLFFVESLGLGEWRFLVLFRCQHLMVPISRVR